VGGARLDDDVQLGPRPLNGGFDAALFETLGIPDLLGKVPQPIAPIGSLAERLTRSAAGDLGLLPNVPVAVGGVDAHMAIAGTGAMGGGSLCFIGGTSVVLMLVTEQAAFGPGIWARTPRSTAAAPGCLRAGRSRLAPSSLGTRTSLVTPTTSA
jgi:ribulose kinase